MPDTAQKETTKRKMEILRVVDKPRTFKRGDGTEGKVFSCFCNDGFEYETFSERIAELFKVGAKFSADVTTNEFQGRVSYRVVKLYDETGKEIAGGSRGGYSGRSWSPSPEQIAVEAEKQAITTLSNLFANKVLDKTVDATAFALMMRWCVAKLTPAVKTDTAGGKSPLVTEAEKLGAREAPTAEETDADDLLSDRAMGTADVTAKELYALLLQQSITDAALRKWATRAGLTVRDDESPEDILARFTPTLRRQLRDGLTKKAATAA
jgi:hypothetical protein